MRNCNEKTYPNLEGKIAERGIKKCKIADALQISTKALSNKLAGKSAFTWNQVKTIQKKFFPDIEKDYLFASPDEQCDQAS